MQLIELNTTIQTRQLHEQLQNRDMVVLETIPDGYIIGISKQTDMKDAMRFLLDQFGNEIVGMRDITGSSRRLFLTNMKAEGAMGC
jgi:hypothetical protein